MKFKIDRTRKRIIFIFEDPRARQGIKEEMSFDSWFEFQSEVNKRVAKSHRA